VDDIANRINNFQYRHQTVPLFYSAISPARTQVLLMSRCLMPLDSERRSAKGKGAGSLYGVGQGQDRSVLMSIVHNASISLYF